MTPGGEQTKPQAELRIRPAEGKDAEGIQQVLKRNGMGDLDPVFWRESWEAYPFAEEFRDIPIGWVLETGDGAVVGNLTNVHTLYEMAGKRLRGVVAAGWAVDVDHRRKSLRMMTTFFKQKGIDLWLNVSANPVTAQVLTSMKIQRIPIPDYGTPCFWAARPRAFARAALQRKAIPAAGALAWLVGVLLHAGDILRRSGRGSLSSPVRRLPAFDDRFDELWQRINAGPVRLRSVRNRAVFEWRFRAEIRAKQIAILVAGRDEKLNGYAVLVRRSGSDLGMDLYDVADIQAVGDDPATYRDLLLGSVRTAREDGVDAVKFMSGTPAKRSPAMQLRPYTYNLPFWQQYFSASPELGAALSTADAWDFSFFDSF